MDPRFTDETLLFLQIIAKNASSRSDTFEVETMRNGIDELHVKINAALSKEFKGTLEEQTIKANSTEIPITIYTPIDACKDKLGIYFHGGGWVIGSRKSHQAIVNYIADTTKTIWINVEYRLGPEHKYPIWLDDAREVTQYIIDNKTSYGVNETAKIGVAGDSAGGMISASLSRTIKGIDFQILIYAGIDMLRQTASYDEFKEQIYFLTPQLLDWFSTNAYRSPDDFQDPKVSALLNTSFEHVPPCLFIVADLDPLRDGNLEYKKLLDKAGIKTKLVLVKGVIHGFFSLPGVFPQACAEAMDTIRDFVAELNNIESKL